QDQAGGDRQQQAAAADDEADDPPVTEGFFGHAFSPGLYSAISDGACNRCNLRPCSSRRWISAPPSCSPSAAPRAGCAAASTCSACWWSPGRPAWRAALPATS